MSALRVGEILVQQKLIRPEQLTKAMDEHKRTGGRLSQVLVQQGSIKESQLLRALEAHYKVPGIDLNTFMVRPEAAALVKREICEKHHIVPVQIVGDSLVVAFADPGNSFIKDDLRFLTRKKIQVVVATESSISSALDKVYGAKVADLSKEGGAADDFAEEVAKVEVLETENSGEPIVKFVNTIMADAISKKASDIHFEPYEKRFRVRLRIDGNMIETTSQPPSFAAAVSSRLKIMAKLDIAEKRRPQDGRIKVKTRSGKDMDFRVSVLPTLFGEKVVLRLLDQSNLQLDMTKLGFEPEDLAIFKEAIKLPQGMLLITGPTGSGKTTTIYSALAELNQPDVNISTAEDPVEFNLEGINQVQMNSDIDLTFANALRSFLRQDPDVIMVGEIRDLETAEISIKAASTGHMVVSTLHTNDAPQTITRLVEIGIPAYVITATVNLIVAQRLVGRVCDSCKTAVEVQPNVLLELGVDPAELAEYRLMRGRGCNVCNSTGIKGRIAIFEVMKITEPIREAILKGASSSELRRLARAQGMRTLRRSGLLKLKRGETTIEQVMDTSIKDV